MKNRHVDRTFRVARVVLVHTLAPAVEHVRTATPRAPRPLIADACVTPRGALWLALGGPRTPGGLLVSRDGATTFRELTRQDPRDPDAHHFYAVFALDDEHVWACGAAGEDDVGVVWRTTDGGAFWEVLMSGDVARGLEAGAMYTQVVFSDARHGFLVCAGDDMLATSDGGRSWQAHPVAGARPFSVHFVDRWRGWLVSQDLDARGISQRTRLFATRDGGRTWRPESHDFAGLPALDVTALRVDEDGSAVLCGPDGMLLYARITDGDRAVRWRFARGTVSGDLTFVARSPDGALWVAGERGALLVSRDGGASYEEVTTNTRADLHALAFMRDADTGAVTGVAVGDRGTILRFDPLAPCGPCGETARAQGSQGAEG